MGRHVHFRKYNRGSKTCQPGLTKMKTNSVTSQSCLRVIVMTEGEPETMDGTLEAEEWAPGLWRIFKVARS